MVSDEALVAKLVFQGCINPIVENGFLVDCKSVPETLIIPRGIIGLCLGCLSGQTELVTVKFPSTLQYIQGFPLSNCINLKNIYIPIELKKFGSQLSFANEARIIYVYSDKEIK